MKYTIDVASSPDREKLVAEIWHGDQLIAEINQEKKTLELEIYVPDNRQSLVLDYDAFIEALTTGKKKLTG